MFHTENVSSQDNGDHSILYHHPVKAEIIGLRRYMYKLPWASGVVVGSRSLRRLAEEQARVPVHRASRLLNLLSGGGF